MGRVRLKMALFLVNHLLAGTHWYKLKNCLLNWTGEIHVGKGTRIVGPIFVTAKLNIGEDVWVGRNFSVEGNGEVTVGDYCDFAPNVTLYTGTHEIGGPERRAGKGVNGRIVIGYGCWICGSSVILPNVEIGNGVLVAAGSVVNKSQPSNQLIAGSPAQKRKVL